MFLDGHNGDCSETYPVGEVDGPGLRLIEAARRCRDDAIAICRPGVPFAEIGESGGVEGLAEISVVWEKG